MQRIQHPTAVNSLPSYAAPTGNVGYFADDTTSPSQSAGTVVPPWWLNMTQDELYNVAAQAPGFTPSNTNRSQVLAGIQSLVSGSVPNEPSGQYRWWATSTGNPAGYLLCDGAAVSRTTYSALFTAIGTTYGIGNGSTTFNLPDARSRGLIAAGQGAGLSNRTVGQVLGAETHQLTEAEMPFHNHGYNRTDTDGSGQSSNAPDQPRLRTASQPFVGTDYRGGDLPHNNMPPSLGARLFVKT
jgi:microcystin-dependent protein